MPRFSIFSTTITSTLVLSLYGAAMPSSKYIADESAVVAAMDCRDIAHEEAERLRAIAARIPSAADLDLIVIDVPAEWRKEKPWPE